MTTTALARLESPPPAAVEERFRDRIDELKAKYTALWWETGTEMPILGEPMGRRRQAENARETVRLIDHLAAQVEAYPETEPERLAWRSATRETVRRFGEERFGWPSGYRDLLFADAARSCWSPPWRTTRSFSAAPMSVRWRPSGPSTSVPCGS